MTGLLSLSLPGVGGALETIVDGKTGVLVAEATAGALATASRGRWRRASARPPSAGTPRHLVVAAL
jgi:hypothetical protein